MSLKNRVATRAVPIGMPHTGGQAASIAATVSGLTGGHRQLQLVLVLSRHVPRWRPALLQDRVCRRCQMITETVSCKLVCGTVGGTLKSNIDVASQQYRFSKRHKTVDDVGWLVEKCRRHSSRSRTVDNGSYERRRAWYYMYTDAHQFKRSWFDAQITRL